MKILHVTGHLGGGVGTVICGWMQKRNKNDFHIIASLDTINKKAADSLYKSGVVGIQSLALSRGEKYLYRLIEDSDIVLLHYWPHPLIKKFISQILPICRLVIWSHNNSPYTPEELAGPDLWIDTSPVQGHGRHIWSTGGVDRFLEIKPKAHVGFNIGYVGTVDYKKMHPNALSMCRRITSSIPDARFTFIGESFLPCTEEYRDISLHFTGKVDDVAPYLAEVDVFGYPLRSDHYGTCEQVLGEAMAAGVVPVVMDNPAEKTIITHCESGFIASSENKYIQFIKYLYDYPDTREIMSDLAWDRAQELYSIDTMISKWNDVFEEMMDNPKTRKEGL
jgi:glycosyltransferase involved in cell wall biosynthesis